MEDQSPAPVSRPSEACPESLALDEETLKKARRKGMQEALVNLASREEIKAHAFKGSELLDALKKSGGLVNLAKRALLETHSDLAIV